MTWQTNAWAAAWLWASSTGPCMAPHEPATLTSAPAAAAPSRHAVALSAAPAAPIRQTRTARAYMQTHFAQSEHMRRALIAGDLTALHAAAEGVAKDEWTPNLRADWRPQLAAVRSAAGAAQKALSLEAAAEAFADLGAACSSCHLVTGGPGSPRFPVPLPGSTASMLAHESATERLWQGVVAPSDAAWLEGAEQLIAAPELNSDVELIASRSRHVRDLAERAKLIAVKERPQLLGELLVTCANCHKQLGVGPSAPLAQ
jgi:hypothetical protein